jgi:hypothetical protein
VDEVRSDPAEPVEPAGDPVAMPEPEAGEDEPAVTANAPPDGCGAELIIGVLAVAITPVGVAAPVSAGALRVTVVVTGCVTTSATGAGAATVTVCGVSTVWSTTTGAVEVTVLWVESELTGCVAGCGETMLWELVSLDDDDMVEVDASEVEPLGALDVS